MDSLSEDYEEIAQPLAEAQASPPAKLSTLPTLLLTTNPSSRVVPQKLSQMQKSGIRAEPPRIGPKPKKKPGFKELR